MQVTLSSKGQITLPKAMREALQLSTGDKIIFEQQADDTYVMKPALADVRVLKGCVSYDGPVKTVGDMEHAISQMKSLK